MRKSDILNMWCKETLLQIFAGGLVSMISVG